MSSNAALLTSLEAIKTAATDWPPEDKTAYDTQVAAFKAQFQAANQPPHFSWDNQAHKKLFWKKLSPEQQYQVRRTWALAQGQTQSVPPMVVEAALEKAAAAKANTVNKLRAALSLSDEALGTLEQEDKGLLQALINGIDRQSSETLITEFQASFQAAYEADPVLQAIVDRAWAQINEAATTSTAAGEVTTRVFTDTGQKGTLPLLLAAINEIKSQEAMPGRNSAVMVYQIADAAKHALVPHFLSADRAGMKQIEDLGRFSEFGGYNVREDGTVLPQVTRMDAWLQTLAVLDMYHWKQRQQQQPQPREAR